MFEQHARLDFILNNACQTVRRPPGFYGHLMEAEALPLDALPELTRGPLARFEELRRGSLLEASALAGGAELAVAADAADSAELAGLRRSAELTQVPLIEGDLEAGSHMFPVGELDHDLQQVDLRTVNSWRLKPR